ncbi:MAG: pirin family protein [Pseudomonadales bacterium]
MSWREAAPARCSERSDDVEMVIRPTARDLGGFSVRRVLPAPARKLVGPFIFFDHMGPATFPPGEGINVRPHPHIGLSTVTYLFEGEILHRDSLGFVQPIRPGAINLMTAGRGIVHSERTSAQRLASGQRLHGIQTWMALPVAAEEIEPAFEHFPAERLPVHAHAGVRATVILGSAFGRTSPVTTHTETLYCDLELADGAVLTLPADVPERALYAVDGDLQIGACRLAAGTMGVLRPGCMPELRALGSARAMLIGGADMGERNIWWNFVSSRADRMEQARNDWREGRFPTVPGDDEFIPLPDRIPD